MKTMNNFTMLEALTNIGNGIIYFYLVPFILIILMIIIRQFHASSKEMKMQKRTQKYIFQWKRILDDQSLLKSRYYKWFTNKEKLEAFSSLTQENDYLLKEADMLKRHASSILKTIQECKDMVSVGYFAYLLFDIENRTDFKFIEYKDFLFKLVESGNVYCRENAINALFQFDDPIIASDVIFSLNRNGIGHNEKLLEDAMLSFDGDIPRFNKKVMDNFNQLNGYYRNTVVKYLGIQNDHRFDEMLRQNIYDESVDTICSIVRLLSKKICPENKIILLQTLRKYSELEENQAAPSFVAATGLSFYPNDEDVFLALRKALSSKHWQLRMNSAESLVNLNLPKGMIEELLNTNDQYAKDALNYALEKN